MPTTVGTSSTRRRRASGHSAYRPSSVHAVIHADDLIYLNAFGVVSHIERVQIKLRLPGELRLNRQVRPLAAGAVRGDDLAKIVAALMPRRRRMLGLPRRQKRPQPSVRSLGYAAR